MRRAFFALLLACPASSRAQVPQPAPTARLGPLDLPVRARSGSEREDRILQGAREVLGRTVAGRPILEFIEGRGMEVRFSDLPDGEHGGFGHYEDGSPVILIARLEGPELKKDETALAFTAGTLAHEGTHALQKLEWELAASVENECEAFFKELEVQHEMSIMAGRPVGTFEMELRYRLLFMDGGVDRLVENIRDGYWERVERALDKEAAERPEKERPKARRALLADWKASGEIDRLRPLQDLLLETKDPARKKDLRKAEAHWKEALADFKEKVGSWSGPDQLNPEASGDESAKEGSRAVVTQDEGAGPYGGH